MKVSGRIRAAMTVLRLLVRFAALIGGFVTVLLPGATFLVHLAPPLFPPISLAMGILCLGVFLVSSSTREGVRKPVNLPPAVHKYIRNANRRRTSGDKAPLGLLILFLTFVSMYYLAFQFWTVPVPAPRKGPPIQIGFHFAEWSLTPEARAWRAANPGQSVEDVMMAFGGYTPGGTTRIWHSWAVATAGGVLIALFCATFFFWARFVAEMTQRVRALRRGSDIENLWNTLSLGG